MRQNFLLPGKERRGRLLLLSVLILSVLLLLNWFPLIFQPPVAQAHAFVIGSDPVDGSTVSTMPAVVRIFFDEPISPASNANVIEPDGKIVNASHSIVSSTNPRELDTPLLTPAKLPLGSYTVRWSALSNEDGHATHGVIGFNVAYSSAGLPGEVILGPSTSNILPELNLQGGLAIAWDWLVMAALTLWVGILVMETVVVGGSRADGNFLTGGSQSSSSRRDTTTSSTQIRNRSLPLQWLCLAALLVGEIISLLLRAALLTLAQGNSGIDLLTIRQVVLETNYGYLWIVRIALIVIALGLLWWTTRQQNKTTGKPTRQEGRSGSRFSELRRQVAEEQANLRQDAEEGNQDLAIANPVNTFQPQGSTGDTVGPAQAKLTFPTRSPRSTDAWFSSSRTGSGRADTLSPLPVRSPSSWPAIIGLILSGLILLTIAPSGDEAQLAQPHISAIVLQWLFLAAQCIWLGGAAYLGYVLLPLLPIIEPDSHAETLATLLRRSTPLLLGAIGVFLVSGLFLSESSLTSPQQLVTDPYGRALLVKMLLVALMLIFSGYALFFLRPKLTRQAILLPVVNAELPARRARQAALEHLERYLKRTMNILSVLGAGVLLCAATMAFFAPPIVFPDINYASSTTGSGSTSSTNAPITQTKTIGNLSVTLQVVPGRVNSSNTVILTMLDSKGNLVTDAKVRLSINMEVMDMGEAHTTITGGSHVYVATFGKNATFTMGGLWDVVVYISRPGQATAQGVFQVMLGE